MSPFDALRRLQAPVALAALLVACAKEVPAPRTWPAGTVLALNEVPITLEEVDEAAGWVAMVEPRFTLPHLRRIALTNVVFPRIAARGIDPARRAEMSEKARAFRAALERGEAPGPNDPVAHEIMGTYREIGLEIWKCALELEPGQWSPVVEASGAYYVLRITDRGKSVVPGATAITLSAFLFPYLDEAGAHAAIESALDRATLTFVDETWRDYVPVVWQYRLQNHQP